MDIGNYPMLLDYSNYAAYICMKTKTPIMAELLYVFDYLCDRGKFSLR
jgi:hypothetical protein